MSMHEPPFGDYPIPEETQQVARAAFPKGNIIMRRCDTFGMFVHNDRFAALFSHEGQPALAPARLALVTVLQFMEGVSDRQAADNVRDRLSWKYALGLETSPTPLAGEAAFPLRRNIMLFLRKMRAKAAICPKRLKTPRSG